MSIDRFIDWKDPPEWGPPTPEKLAAVAKDFLGDGWWVEIDPFPDNKEGCWINVLSKFKCSFHLKSERTDLGDPFVQQADEDPCYRWFQVYFPTNGERTSVITRHVDSFTGALADRYTEIIAKWWNGEIEWPH